MCYECGDFFHNVESLPAFEDFGVKPKRDHGYEFDHGISVVHDDILHSGGHGHSHGHNHFPSDTHTHTHDNGTHHSHEHGNHNHFHIEPITDGDGNYVPHTPSGITDKPTYPTLEDHTYEDLQQVAREIVEKDRIVWQSEGGDLELGARPGAGYDMEEGEFDRALMVVESNYEPNAYRAIADAMREKDVTVDIVTLDRRGRDIDAWDDELPGIREGMPAGHPLLAMRGVRWWEDLAEDNEQYDFLLYGVGGPNRKVSNLEYDRIPWRTEADLVSSANEFPVPVWDMINDKTAEVVTKAKRVRITDPEGTEIEYTNYDDEDKYFARNIPGHVMGHPTYLTPEIDTTGVVAGTLNHAGAFPRIEVELEDAKVVDVRGGGRYGQLWRETLEAAEHIQYPGLPEPGLFWLWEVAIGTHPKVSRPPVDDINKIQFPEMDRRRSGIIHCGFGIQYPIEPYAARLENVPWGHVHVHLNFATFEATMPDDTTFTLIDDGHLTILDDPEVRKEAAKYGDPDELLSEEWIPAVPGITTEGDYNEEYAQNPKEWIRKEMKEQAVE